MPGPTLRIVPAGLGSIFSRNAFLNSSLALQSLKYPFKITSQIVKLIMFMHR